MKFIKGHKKLITILCAFLLYTVITYQINYDRASKNQSPILLFKGSMAKDGGTIAYYGIGYMIIDWQTLDGNKGYEIRAPFYSKFFKGLEWVLE